MQIGFELWTMQNDILFDNIYIGHSVGDAKTLQKETFDIKHASEKAQEDADKPKDDDMPKSPSDLKFMDDPVLFVKEKWELFVEIAKRDPLEAAKFVPEIAGALALGVVALLAIIIGSVAGSGAAPSKEQIKGKAAEAKDAALKAKDQAADAAASGIDKAKDEVNKRTTRSAAKDE